MLRSRGLRLAGALFALALAGSALLIPRDKDVFGVLASAALIGRQGDSFYLLATNQLLRPWQEQWLVQGRPAEIAFDADKRFLAVLNSRSVHILDGATGIELGKAASRTTSYTGLAFRPGTREVWASEATRTGPDSIFILKLDEKGVPGPPARIEFKRHAIPAGIAFSPDGATAWIGLSNDNSIAVIDANSRRITREIPAGMAPYGLVISPKHNRLFVSNRGGRRPKADDVVAYSSGSSVVTDPKTGATATGTVSSFDLRTMQETQIDTGLAPASMALSPDESTLAVANAHSDSVTLIDIAKNKTSELKVPSWPEGSFGATPSGVAFAPDGGTLYVSCGGVNTIAVFRRAANGRWESKGVLTSGWFPSAMAVDREGSLRVANIKGAGSTLIKGTNHNSRVYEGSLWKIPAPPDAQLNAGVREAAAANTPKFEPAGGVAELSKLGIKHVFFIIKENRTYDQVFGDLPKGNRDPNLVMYGRDVTPNHHSLAEKYVLLDNFYTGGAISFDGHQWLMQGFVNDYVERSLISAPRGYAWNMADALTVAPTGFFWQDTRRPLDVRLYGPMSLHIKWDPATHRPIDINETELRPWPEYWKLYKEGKWHDAVGSRSGVPALQPLVSAQYPASSMNISDQIRAEAWLEELAKREKSGQMPNLLIFTMTSDHTMGTRPGFPTPRAMVADNDLALGRMVEGITKSRFWKDSLILVTEDDAQDGVDHVDGRRTICLAIGPRVRRGMLDSNHYNHSSMIRTVQEIFRIRPRVRYATSARPMTSVFTTDVNTDSYTALTPKISLTEMNPPMKSMTERQLWAAQQSMRLNAHHVDDFPAQTMNRILWGDAKGWNTPYPGERRPAKSRQRRIQ